MLNRYIVCHVIFVMFVQVNEDHVGSNSPPAVLTRVIIPLLEQVSLCRGGDCLHRV